MTTGRLLWLALCLWLFAPVGCGAATERSGSAEFAPLDNPATFVARPYVQLGETPAADRLTLMWHATPGSVQRWKLQVGVEGQWRDVTPIARRSVAVEQIVAHDIYSAELTDLAPGCPFYYRLLRDDVPVFAAEARAPRPAGVASRIVVMGDAGSGSPQQAQTAYQIGLQRPDLVGIAGDIVYGGGRLSEYQRNFFPYYNVSESHPALGAPLLRAVPFFAAPGNHDISRDTPIDRKPDGFGYFAYWAHPRNGPITTIGAPNTPSLVGRADAVRALTTALGDGYPQTGNYSFDYGDTHWTVLDSNPYVDWSDPRLRRWLERDLLEAQGKLWRFALFHHPGVHSSQINDGQRQTQMRLVSDLFERYGVDIVFAGHYHNYQRSYPVKFVLDTAAWRARPLRAESPFGHVAVPGRFVIDRTFDGNVRTWPDGVIYVVTGAGGATLYEPELTDTPEQWQPYTARFNGSVHSFTVLDIDSLRLTLRQITASGHEIDRITVTQPEPVDGRAPHPLPAALRGARAGARACFMVGS